MKPMEVYPGLILGGIADLDAMLAMRPDVLAPLDRLPGSVWRTGFRGEILYYPITDRDVLPDDVLDELVDQIIRRVEAGRRIALFCHGGYGRTGYVAACALYRLGVEKPLTFLWRHYSSSAVETETQDAAVMRFFMRHADRIGSAQARGSESGNHPDAGGGSARG